MEKKEKKSVISIINDKITEELFAAKLSDEKLVWQKPWLIYPKQNFVSHRKYNAVNRMLLGNDGEEFYLTLAQVNELKGTVKEFNWSIVSNQYKKEYEVPFSHQARWFEEVVERDGKKFASVWCHSFTKLLKLSDTDIPEPERKEFVPKEDIDSFIASLPFHLAHGGSESSYDSTHDVIRIPNKDRFDTVEDYYFTVFKWIAKACGSVTRLNNALALKDEKHSQRNQVREELITEIAGCAVLHMFGLQPPVKNTAAYIDTWLEAVKADEQLFVYSAQRVEKILTFLGL